MARKSERYPALYERLSHDDELQCESNSISNQKRILEDYAEQQGFANCVHFTDDGISGTRFDRPGFQKMIDEVKADRISVVIVKDMSRFGRDYLTGCELLVQFGAHRAFLHGAVSFYKSGIFS